MPYYIKDRELGKFVGEFLGFGFYEEHIKVGDCSPEERPIPIPFSSREEAQAYMKSWTGGIPEGTEIIFEVK